MSIELMAPTGARIVGTAEEAIGVGRLSHLRRDGEHVDWGHSGQTDGLLDTQRTVSDATIGVTLFEDEAGNWWRWDRLVPLDATPDASAKPDVKLGDWPGIGEALELRRENARLRALLAACRDTLAEWADAHVWDESAGEKPDAEHLAFMARIEGALAGHQVSAPQPKPVRIVVGVEGGIVQGASADAPCSIVVLDYDTEGANPDDDKIEMVAQPGTSMTVAACPTDHEAATTPEARAWVDAIHNRYGAQAEGAA